jgi:hypothetical protein
MKTVISGEGLRFAVYPFEYDGHKFISRVLADTDMFIRLQQVPEPTVIQWNQECLDSLMGKGLSLTEIKSKLYELNKGASAAYIELE